MYSVHCTSMCEILMMLPFPFSTCSTRLGIYKENCGLDNVLMSWGHDGKYHREIAAQTILMAQFICSDHFGHILKTGCSQDFGSLSTCPKDSTSCL